MTVFVIAFEMFDDEKTSVIDSDTDDNDSLNDSDAAIDTLDSSQDTFVTSNTSSTLEDNLPSDSDDNNTQFVILVDIIDDVDEIIHNTESK